MAIGVFDRFLLVCTAQARRSDVVSAYMSGARARTWAVQPTHQNLIEEMTELEFLTSWLL